MIKGLFNHENHIVISTWICLPNTQMDEAGQLYGDEW